MGTTEMGITYAEVELVSVEDLFLLRRNHISDDQVKRLKVLALVDSGASMMAVTESLKRLLDLPKVDDMQAELGDGSIVQLEVVGPVEVRFQNRRTIVNAMVVPDSADVLLSAIPMQGLDVLMDPKREQLIVNPESPDMARMLLK
jgi:clan AA aspartic protease